ncbi:glutathione ABC transporter permease GsiC [Taylorella equigenitalis]|uniref:glutathione ABC transporter permease GsiC n=1 Tax=Taylorella equigenitalis TaxID=29575 RepID=UPI00387793D9
MLSYFIKRIIGMVPTLFLICVCVFLFVHILPGDPAVLAAGPDADAQTIQLIREDMGLNLPLWEQFVNYMSNVLHGDLGHSLRSKRPVFDEIAIRFTPTMLLTLTSMFWSVIVGLVIGVVSAIWRNSWPDRLFMTLAVSGISFPAFAFGMLLIQIFAVWLGWLPSVGADSWKHYILPSLTLGLSVAAVLARFTRASFVEVINEDFVRTARAKGLSEKVVMIKHSLRNALIPVVTMMGLQFGFLLGGSIVFETVFGWPGMGSLLIDSVNSRDYPMIQGLVLLFSFEFIVINLVVDILYGVINPTIRYK